jgi:hypothetical protein
LQAYSGSHSSNARHWKVVLWVQLAVLWHCIYCDVFFAGFMNDFSWT